MPGGAGGFAPSGVWARARSTEAAKSLLAEEVMRDEVGRAQGRRLAAWLRLGRVTQWPKLAQLGLFLGIALLLLATLQVVAA